jgi:hypothetical protein
MSKMLDNMKEEAVEVAAKLVAAREKAATANALVESLERENRALNSAIDILSGNEPKTPAPVEPQIDRTAILQAIAALQPDTVSGGDDVRAKRLEGVMPKHDIVFHAPEGWTKGVLNGEEILLEPGMTVMKNSFGEEVIAKIGTVFAPMSEPLVPEKHAELLPPIEGYENFSPEDLLDG